MIYLDNAATTYPKPNQVVEMMKISALKYGANPGRSSYEMCKNTTEQIYNVRKKLKEMFNASGEENVVFTQNCTASLNIAVKGLAKSYTRVITSNLEHNSVMRPLEKLKSEKNIAVDIFEKGKTKEETLENFKRLIRYDTSLVVCTYASNVFGDILPIKEMGRILKKKNIAFIVDGAQAAGVIDIDIKRDNISCLCLPGHKGLYGVMGTGVLVINDDVLIDTLFEGGTGTMSKSLVQPFDYPERLESGTLNVPGITALGKGIDFLNEIGIEKIHNYECGLIKYLYSSLKKNEDVILYNEFDEKNFVPILSFNVKNMSSEETVQLLSVENIAVRGGFHCNANAHKYYGSYEIGTVRVSVSCFNTKKDMDILLNSVKKIAKFKNV